MPVFLLILALALPTVSLCAQTLTGTYVLPSSPVRLTIDAPVGTTYTGTLMANQEVVPLEGTIHEGTWTGTVSNATLHLAFEARQHSSGLHLVLTEQTSGQTQHLAFQRVPASPAVTGDVSVNGLVLDEQQRRTLETTYGVQPRPGAYWYDARSGLYGAMGHAAFGFMHPGHDFGPLPSTASGGTTGVRVNGREIPQNEWMVWSQLLGAPLQPGSYWLNAQGHAGYEGSDQPVVNLYEAARRRGVPTGGDSFWSSRFSAGNYDAQNERGYVSVPGYGPVGYGF